MIVLENPSVGTLGLIAAVAVSVIAVRWAWHAANNDAEFPDESRTDRGFWATVLFDSDGGSDGGDGGGGGD